MELAERIPLYMQRNKIIRFLRSFVLLPVVATTLSTGTIASPVASPAVSQIQNYIKTANPAAIKKALQEEQAKKIDAYFRDRGMPMEGFGMKLVLEAEKNGLDWQVVAAVAVRESTGGKFACKNKKAPNNPFGWHSCKAGFASMDEAIETVARNLGGNNPNTAHHYDGDLRERLETYNGRAVASYADDVFAIMEKMAKYEI